MNLAVLRSRLSHASSDLQTLALADLSECKWSIRKRICLYLFSSCTGLAVQAQELTKLSEKHDQELGLMKRSNASKDQKMESEQMFRSEFMRVVVEGLHRLRWPPTLEAFANPIDQMFGGREEFLGAIAFILDVGFSGNDLVSSPRPSSSSTVSPRSTSSQRKVTPSSMAVVCDSAPEISVSPRTKISASVPVTPQRSDGWDTPTASLPPPAQYLDLSSLSLPRTEAKGMNRREDLIRVVEKLQFQNESLSKQVKQLQLSICSRDRAETSMNNVFFDFIRVVDEVLGLSQSGVESDSDVTADEHRRFVKSVNKEAHKLDMAKQERERMQEVTGIAVESGKDKDKDRDKDKDKDKDRDKDVVTSRPKHRVLQEQTTASVGKGVVWTKLKEKVTSLHAQWTQAVKDARTSVLRSPAAATAEHGGFLTCSPPAAGKSGKSRGRPTSSVADTWAASSVPVHRVLGVAPPQSWMSASGDGSGFATIVSAQDDPQFDLSLDLHRVHLLQRELVAISDSLLSLTDPSPLLNSAATKRSGQKSSSSSRANATSTGDSAPASGAGISLPCDPCPANIEASRRQLLQTDLFLKVNSLALHLAGLAPLVPLSLDPSSPLLSHMTGLELLVQEVSVLPMASKASKAVQRLRSICDRALAEQVACVRCVQRLSDAVAQWAAHSSSAVLSLTTVADAVSASFQKSKQVISEHSSALKAIRNSFESAESCRLSAAAADGRQTAVSPMETLSRGTCGPEVAGLVNALRIHCTEDLAEIDVQLGELDFALTGLLKTALTQLQSLGTAWTHAGNISEQLLKV